MQGIPGVSWLTGRLSHDNMTVVMSKGDTLGAEVVSRWARDLSESECKIWRRVSTEA